MTHPPALVMVERTASAPGTSKSPIATLALNHKINGICLTLVVDAGVEVI